MNASIYFPPQFEPFQPYLAGASLISAFKEEKINADYFDLNLSYYHYILNSVTDSFLKRNYFNSKLTYENYLDSIKKLELLLQDSQTKEDVISFYDTKFGNQLYEPEGLRNLISSEWALHFRKFLEIYFTNHYEALRSSIQAITIVVHDQLPMTIILSELLRNRNPHSKIIWGGPLVSRIGEEIKDDPFLVTFFDKMVIGPGEPFIRNWIPDESNHHVLLKTITSSIKPVTEPNFSSYPLQDYLSHFLVLPYLTSRGCYWRKCEFCCHYKPFDHYEETDIPTVVDQLESLSLKYNTRFFSFSDECIPSIYLKKLSKEILRRQLKIRWYTFTRFERGFDDTTCDLLYKAGCRVLMFGLESASQRILNLMNKGIKIEEVRPVLKACKNAGISVRVDIMIGFPTETREESDQTLFFLLENKDVLDTPFSITPLSKFELQGDAIMQRHLSRFGVKSLGKIRGPLDYKYKYQVSAGMSMDEVEEQYGNFIKVIHKEFKAHTRMPNNKTHAFLIKCIYSDNDIERTIFDDQILSSYLDDYKFEFLTEVLFVKENHETWILRSKKDGGSLRIEHGLVMLVEDIKKNGRITKISQEVEIKQQIAEFLTYLVRQGFLKSKRSSSLLDSSSLRD